MSGRPTPAIAQPPVSSRHAEVVVACALCAQVAAPSALRATRVPIPDDRQTSTTTCHDDNDTDHVENESRAFSRLAAQPPVGWSYRDRWLRHAASNIVRGRWAPASAVRGLSRAAGPLQPGAGRPRA